MCFALSFLFCKVRNFSCKKYPRLECCLEKNNHRVHPDRIHSLDLVRTSPHLYPPPTPLLSSGVKKISLTVGQTDGWVSCRSYRERVARRRPWARLLNLRFSRSSRILRVPPRKRYCYNRRGVFEENRVAPRRPMAGTGRRKGLYRRPVYWVACDRWKKVSLSAASSEIPRRPWRTTSLAVPFSTAGTRSGDFFVQAVPFVRDDRRRRSSRQGKEIPQRLNEGFRIPRYFSFEWPQWVASRLDSLFVLRSIPSSFNSEKKNQTPNNNKWFCFFYYMQKKNKRED